MIRFAIAMSTLVLAAALPGGGVQSEETPTVRMVRGHVVALDPARRLVVVKHEEIRPLQMPEMQMEYVVPEGAAFPELTPGDKVRFAVVRIDGRHVITRVAPLPPARSSAGRRGQQGAARSDQQPR